MFIYKIYKTREEINTDIELGKLKKDYIFAYDRRLYKVIDSNFTKYQPLNPVVFKNQLEKYHVVKMCNLLWYDSDTVICMDGIKEVTQCSSV